MNSLSNTFDFLAKFKKEISNINILRFSQMMIDFAGIVVLIRAIIEHYYDFFIMVPQPLIPPFGGDFHFMGLLVVLVYCCCNTKTGLELICWVISLSEKLEEKFDVFRITCWSCLISFVCSISILLWSVKLIVDYENEIIYDANIYVYIAVIYLLYRVYETIKRQNKPFWDRLNTRGTGFYDSDRNEIPENSFVIYKGREYSVESRGNSYYLIDPKEKMHLGQVLKLDELIDAGKDIYIKKN